MKEKTELIGDDNSHLVIPLDKQKLGNFLSSLLGQPQSIDRKMFGVFDTDLSWIIELLNTLHTRISRQAKSKRLYFNAKIRYSDNEIRSLNSFEELASYNESFKRYTASITIRFAYIVEFPDKENPEKQEFEITIDENPEEQLRSDSVFDGILKKHVGLIAYRIYHTERTWGDDIDKLIGEYVGNVFKKVTKSKSVIRLIFLNFSAIFSFIAMYGPLLRLQIAAIDNRNSLIEKLHNSYKNTIDWKVNYLYELSSQKTPVDKVSAIISVLGPLSAGAILVLTIMILKRRKPSFICLTEQDRKYRSKTLGKKKFHYLWLIVGYLLSLIIGVVANFLYNWWF